MVAIHITWSLPVAWVAAWAEACTSQGGAGVGAAEAAMPAAPPDSLPGPAQSSQPSSQPLSRAEFAPSAEPGVMLARDSTNDHPAPLIASAQLDASLPDSVCRTYCRLRLLADAHGRLSFSDQDFQAQFGVSRRTLYRHLAILAQLGLLRYCSTRGDPIRFYQVEFPQDAGRLSTVAVPQDARWLSAVEAPAGAKIGTDMDGFGVKNDTLNTSSSSSSLFKWIKKYPKRGREEEVNLNSANDCSGAKNGNALDGVYPDLDAAQPGALPAGAPPGPYPLTLSQASCHPDIHLYQQVTGLFPGNNSWGAIIDAISLLRQRHPGEDLEAILAPYWQAWQKGRRKDGSPFDRFSLPWLTEWAINGVIPDRSRPPAPSPMDIINRRLAAMAAAKNKTATEAVAKEGAPADADPADAAATAVSPVELITTPYSS